MEFDFIVVFVFVILELFFWRLKVNFLILGAVFLNVVFFGIVVILVDRLVLMGGLEGFLG